MQCLLESEQHPKKSNASKNYPKVYIKNHSTFIYNIYCTFACNVEIYCQQLISQGFERGIIFKQVGSHCGVSPTSVAAAIIKMPEDTEPQRRFGHVAVRFEHYILVTGGVWFRRGILPPAEIWMYNLYTKQWRKHVTADREKVPLATVSACAVVIESTVYNFGGRNGLGFSSTTNALWALSKTPGGYFAWNDIMTSENVKAPAPRFNHTGWEYSRKLWVFGGYGQSPDGYLHGKWKVWRWF